MKKFVLGVLIAGSFTVLAQESNVPVIKPEVAKEQALFKKTVWRRMNLLEKQNRPFFSRNAEFSRLVIEAVDEGLLTPYRSDSTLNFMPDIIFNSNISVEQEDNPFVGGGFSSGFTDPNEQQQQGGGTGPSLQRIPTDLFSVIYIKEDVIFDRNRSRMYYYIRSITLALPSSAGVEWNPAGFEKPVAHFKYSDLMDIFRGPYADRAKWYNSQNQAKHVNFGDAFELRLFSAPIIKVSNPENLDIRQEYADLIAKDPLNALIIQQKYEYDIMEYESQLWEY